LNFETFFFRLKVERQDADDIVWQ